MSLFIDPAVSFVVLHCLALFVVASCLRSVPFLSAILFMANLALPRPCSSAQVLSGQFSLVLPSSTYSTSSRLFSGSSPFFFVVFAERSPLLFFFRMEPFPPPVLWIAPTFALFLIEGLIFFPPTLLLTLSISFPFSPLVHMLLLFSLDAFPVFDRSGRPPPHLLVSQAPQFFVFSIFMLPVRSFFFLALGL